MIFPRFLAAASTVFLFSACGGSAPAPKSAPEAESSDAEAPESGETEVESAATEQETGPQGVPMECHDGEDPCVPDPKWAKGLCQDVYPAVALYLFQESSPFTRGYISARKVKAVNASGGATSGDEWLVFDEEVVLVQFRKASKDGMQVSGAGDGYEAIRLDGSCVTLGSDEVRTRVAPSPKHTKVPWRYIGDDMQDALRKVPAIREAYIARRQECKGAFSGTVTDKCIRMDDALNREIVKALKSGEAELPQPELRP